MTKTVDGMCADCWGVKDAARARRWLRSPRTRPLFDLDDPIDLLWLLAVAVPVILGLLFVASQWI